MTTLISYAKTINELNETVNSDMNIIDEWISSNRMSINWNKSHYFIIGTDTQEVTINVNANILTSCEEMEILGVIIDKRLSFGKHIEKVVNKTSKILGVIKRIRYYVNDKSLKILYYSMIESRFRYASTVWGFTYDTHINRLIRIQKRFSKLICDSYEEGIRKFNLLHIRGLVLYNSFTYIYKSTNNLSLDKFFVNRDTRQTRHTNSIDLILKKCTFTYLQHSLFYKGVVEWNNIPPLIRTAINFNIFKKRIVEYLLSLNYF